MEKQMKKIIVNLLLGITLYSGFASLSNATSCTGSKTSNECSNSDLNGTNCQYYSSANATVASSCGYSCTDGCEYCSCGHSDCSGSGSWLAPCNSCSTATSWNGTQCGPGGTSGTCEGSGSCTYS